MDSRDSMCTNRLHESLARSPGLVLLTVLILDPIHSDSLSICQGETALVPIRQLMDHHKHPLAGESNLLASLGHTGRRSVVLGHTLNAQTLTDEQKKGSSKFTILC